jgi:hypothetical protein
MKNVKFMTMAIAVCLMALATGTAKAQGKAAFSTDKVVQKETDEMVAKLGLNADQKTALLALNKEKNATRGQAVKALRDARQKNETSASAQSGEVFKNANKKTTDDYEKSLKAILTPEQFNKLKKEDVPAPKKGNN